LGALLAATLLLGACSPAPSSVPTASAPGTTLLPATATPGPSAPPAADVYADIRTAVEAIRGLQPTAPVEPVTIDKTQLVANLTAEFDAENSAADQQFDDEKLIALQLIAPDHTLRELTLDFQGGNVAGYYSPDKDELFVVSRSGGLGPLEKSTYSHEFTHQLQDQRFDLGKLGTDATHQSDRALAQLALIEGDAVSVQNRWMTANLTAQEMGQLVTGALDPEALAALQRAPAYLRETSLFPYLSGNALVESVMAAGGGYQAVNAAFAKPPLSTEQVLHPEKYVAGEAPVTVKLPTNLGPKIAAGWTDAGEDTLGELVIRIWLSENSVPATTAATAAAGWGGDRLVLLRGPGGNRTIGLVTDWDTPADAAQFAAAASTAIEHMASPQMRGIVSGSKAVVLTLGQGAKLLLAALGGAASDGQ
jgi:hypothetical protein